MSQTQRKPLEFDSFEAFLEWERFQDVRHELVDGVPVAMTGGTEAHDIIQGNIYAALREKLRGGPCRPFTGNMAVKTGHRQGRYPDVTVDCGPRHPQNRSLPAPTAAFEVLSADTRGTDFTEKLWEFDALPSVAHYVLFEQGSPHAYFYSRAASGSFPLRPQEIKGMDGAVELPVLGTSLTLAEAYRDVAFEDDLDPEAPPTRSPWAR